LRGVGELPAADTKVDGTAIISNLDPRRERCYECHGEKKQKSEFRLDNKSADAIRGGESGKTRDSSRQ
jgi:hypothetical protein